MRFLEVVVALAIKEFEQRRPKLTSRIRRKINSQAYMYLCDRSSHLSCKRDQNKIRNYMDRRVTSPTWGSPPPCKQSLILRIESVTCMLQFLTAVKYEIQKNPQLVAQHEQICCTTSCEFDKKNEQQSQNLLLEVDPCSTFCNKFLQPATNVFVAQQVEGFCILYFAAFKLTLYNEIIYQ